MNVLSLAATALPALDELGSRAILAFLAAGLVVSFFALWRLAELTAGVLDLRGLMGPIAGAGAPTSALPPPSWPRPPLLSRLAGTEDGPAPEPGRGGAMPRPPEPDGFTQAQLVRDAHELRGPLGKFGWQLRKLVDVWQNRGRGEEHRLAGVAERASGAGERIAVLATQPGSGSTTVVSAIAQLFGELHGDWVAIVSARMAGEEGRRDGALLADLAAACPALHVFGPAVGNPQIAPGAGEMSRLASQVERDHNRLLFDVGPDTGTWRDEALMLADRLIVVTPAGSEGERLALRLLDKLADGGHPLLCASAVVVANRAAPRFSRSALPPPGSRHPVVALGSDEGLDEVPPLIGALRTETRQDLYRLAALTGQARTPDLPPLPTPRPPEQNR